MTIEQLKTEAMLTVKNAQAARELMSEEDEFACFRVDDGKNFYRVRISRTTGETEISKE